jgi:hypothetical protein
MFWILKGKEGRGIYGREKGREGKAIPSISMQCNARK